MKKLLYLVILIVFGSCQQQDCTNGIQDGNELAVDCGGDCPTCHSCFDGIKNQNEVNIDCGGICTACDIIYAENGAAELNLLYGSEDTLYLNTGYHSFRAEVPEGSSLKLELVIIGGQPWGYLPSSNVGWSVSIYSGWKQDYEILNPGISDVTLSLQNGKAGSFSIRYFENGTTETKRKVIIWS